MTEFEPLQLTLEDGRRALAVHVLEKGHQLHTKYGSFIDEECLSQILKDRDFVRFPTVLIFDSTKIDSGMFARVEETKGNAGKEFIIYVHEFFKRRTGDLPALVFYQLVQVNYGEFASFNEAEEFASAALGMEKDYYYDYLCRLVDSIPQKEV